MVRKIISYSVNNPLYVFLGIVLLTGWGIWSLFRIPLDAVPDITNNQAQIVTFSPALSADEVEYFITAPIERKLANLPGVNELRSITRYGLSVITVVFEENRDIYTCRQLIAEQLNILSDEIPLEYGKPELMPITTGLGEIFQYVLVIDPKYENAYSLYDLRTIQDWIVKKQLAGIPGVIEISSLGGFVKQYEIAYHPEKLSQHEITIDDIRTAILANNANVGSGYLSFGSNAVYVKTDGLLKNEQQIKDVPVALKNNIPIQIKHVADVRPGHALRYGACTMDGKGEVVGGIVLMLKDESSSKVLKNIHERIKKIESTLPPGITIYPFLDRSHLIQRTITTVIKNLTEGALIVVLILLLFLGSYKAALITASVIPLSMLFAFGMMNVFGVSANLMSLGAIDFGILVDGAVIIVEGVMHHFNIRNSSLSMANFNIKKQEIATISSSIYSKAFFGILIILLVLLPVLSFEGVEGKMFQPMILTLSFALIGSLILSMTYVPVVCTLFLHPDDKHLKFSNIFQKKIESLYSLLLEKSFSRGKIIIFIAFLSFVASIFILVNRGAEFVPNLEEGNLALQVLIEPGSSLESMIATTTKIESVLLNNFQEVKHVISKIGSSEVPTDPMAIEEADIMIILHSKSSWKHRDKNELVSAMKSLLSESFPHIQMEFSQPIQLRFNELLSGNKSDISIKILGEDRDVLNSISKQVFSFAKNVKGAADVRIEINTGLPYRIYEINRPFAAISGVRVSDINTALQSFRAGIEVGQFYENEKRFSIVIRSADTTNNASVHFIPIKTAYGNLPFYHFVKIRDQNGTRQISRERGMRKVEIGINIRGRDVKSVVNEIENYVKNNVELPPGVLIDYGGQFENLQRAVNKLELILPIVILIILFLLYIAFNDISIAFLIFSVVPLATIGGVFALLLRNMPFSISASIGFIALFGIAVLNGVVLMSVIQRELRNNPGENIYKVVLKACMQRVRPVLLTGMVAAFGFLPMALSTSAGAEVQRPLASVVFGGLITATILTLFVLPNTFLVLKTIRKFIKHKSFLFTVILSILSGNFSLNAQPEQLEISLHEAIEIGMTNNLSIKNSLIQTEISRLAKLTAIDPGPTTISYTYGQINFINNDYNFETFQNLNSITRQIANYKRAKVEYEYTKNNQLLARKILRRDIINTWTNLLFANWIMNIYKLEYENAINLKQQINSLKSNQALKPINILLIENQLKEISIRYQTAKNNVSRYQSDLRKILSLPADIEVIPKDTIFNHQHEFEALLLSDLFTKEIELKEMLAYRDMKIMEQIFFPDIQIGYFNQSLEKERGFRGVYIGIQIPLVAHSAIARIKQSKLMYLIEKNNAIQRKIELSNDLKFLIDSFERLSKEIEDYSKNQLNYSIKLKQTALSEFINGSISSFEYVQAISQMINTEVTYLQVLLQYYLLINEINFLCDEN
jgi:cobalt-zinc-cadmium resistance protein CzcA